MSNIGRTIQDFFCNGAAGSDEYGLEDATIEAEQDDYIVLRTVSGYAVFIDFYIWERGERKGISLSKQEMIDKWWNPQEDY